MPASSTAKNKTPVTSTPEPPTTAESAAAITEIDAAVLDTTEIVVIAEIDNVAPEPEVTTVVAAPTGRGVLSRLVAAGKRHLRVVGVVASCALCLGLGWGLARWSAGDGTGSAAADNVLATHEDDTPQPGYLAAVSRRHEPIQPLVPFSDLDPVVVKLGQKLFQESGLSGNGRMSCATCHVLEAGGSLTQATSQGMAGQATGANIPSLFNVALNCAQGWDGHAESLEQQTEEVITSPRQLGASWDRVIKFLGNDAHYRAAFEEAFQSPPNQELIAKALATFERSLITTGSRFDQWLAGAENALDGEEFGGYYLFKKYGCIRCHQGAGVGGTMFQPLGVAKAYYADDASGADLGRFNVTGQERDRHVFRVPQLRNVELTAPYLHDGSVATLEEAVALMLETQCGEVVSAEDVRRIVLFLKTLTGNIDGLKE